MLGWNFYIPELYIFRSRLYGIQVRRLLGYRFVEYRISAGLEFLYSRTLYSGAVCTANKEALGYKSVDYIKYSRHFLFQSNLYGILERTNN